MRFTRPCLFGGSRLETLMLQAISSADTDIKTPGRLFCCYKGTTRGNQLQERPTNWLTFVARYRDGSLERFAVDAFTLLRGNYTACDDAGKQQEEGSLKLGEIVLVYRDRGLVT